ncbi:hypothetical protein LAUMK4_04400 [Mycobacterium persicum]|uniref:Uncharacterized protein n=1 Tax=Mycobacterium persicum TaxID=1487726 RepID=A0ABY6RNG8_9MYCO|nr:hypothetical protein LAUMK15_04811 [Mycobacterium persicum]VAZ98902.1 hypothetical protein LAUMK4_04400 [Mycobacterium persicum]
MMRWAVLAFFAFVVWTLTTDTEALIALRGFRCGSYS